MRRPFLHLLTLLLAWCVGFQTTALAMGPACALDTETGQHGAASTTAHLHHHHAQMSGAEMSMDQHAHHVGSKGSTSTNDHEQNCRCTCGDCCAMPGCASAASVIGSNGAQLFVAADAFVVLLQEPQASLRDAHGLDLIRPPSKS